MRPFVRIERGARWQNKHENVSGSVAAFYDVWNLWEDESRDRVPWRPGLAGLQRAIRDAQAAGASVRAIGGSWSLSDVAYCREFMVNTKPLDARDIGIQPQNLVPSAAAGADRLMFAQCGNTIQDVNDALAAKGLALSTSGESDGQTLCGAIATGTHGAANQVGGMQESVVGLHLLAEDGEPFWIERASRPVVNERFLGFIDTPVANLVRDDDLFDAALVSFGAFGIVHALMLEVEPLYSLESYSWRYDFDQVRPVLGTLNVAPLGLPEGSRLPFHFEVTLNPYRTRPGDNGAYVRFMYKRDGGCPPPSRPNPGGHRPGDDLLGIIGTLTDLDARAIPDLVTFLMDSNLPTFGGTRATPGYTFGPTSIRGRGTSTEMGFRLSDVASAVDIIVDVANRQPFGGVVALRYVKQSNALLAFTRYEPTCTIEIQAVDSARTKAAFAEIWGCLDTAGIPFTFHWGQALIQEPGRYRRVFGDRLERWLAAKQRFLSPAARKLFANDLVRKVGLE